jgi:hypothetical protein
VIEDIDCIGDIILDRSKKNIDKNNATDKNKTDKTDKTDSIGDVLKSIVESNNESTAAIITKSMCNEDEPITLDDILNVINTENHDFIALNYYSFLTDYNIINEKDFAPVENITFNRAYDILNYPSVGHWSGFIIKSEIAKFYLKFILNQNPNYNFEKYRGIIGALMHLSLSKSKGTSFFYGKQLLAVRVPDNIDYNILEHLYLDNIKTFNKYYLDGIIIESDYRYRQKLVLENLTKAILLTSIYCNDSKMRSYEKEFDLIFNQNLKYKYFHKFIFAICRIKIIKFLVKYMYILKKKLQNE